MLLDPARITEVPGTGWCRAWTTAVDEALRSFLEAGAPPRPVAVVALGSYARRELCPASDIDLLILHDGWGGAALHSLVEALCYPLWDAGLAVGHAVRTVKESVRAAGERVDTATALTDRRLVAGDANLAADLGARMDRWLRKHGGSVLGDLADADAARQAAAGTEPGMLEPDLKDGAGGLRDLHSLRWAAACVLGEVGLDPLVGARHISAVDRRDLAAAGADLLAARCALHLVQGRNARDVLRLDLQDEVAALLGMADGDVLLHRLGLAARLISHVHGRTWTPLLTDAQQGRRRRRPPPETLDDGIVLADGLVEASPGRTLAAEPSLGLRTIAGAARRSGRLGRATSERFRRELATSGDLPWDADGRRALLDTLAQGSRMVGALRDADHIGLLAAHLPEWSRVRGRPQRNPFHRFDLDTHGIQAVCELVAVAEGGDGEARRALFAELDDPDILLLGTMLHDVGKAWPGDHSAVGADVGRRWVEHMGFSPARADSVSQLIRHHLLLPDVATRRDIDDPAEVAAVARAVGDVELLDGLFLLTLADSRATGPSAHSPWKDGLIAELHGRVRGVLAQDASALRSAFDPDVAVAAARAVASVPGNGADLAAVERLLVGLDDRYVLAASPEQCRVHAGLIAPPPGEHEIRARWDAGVAEGTDILSVVGRDRLGFMADCAGVLAGHGLAVLDARAFTREGRDGPDLALDWFVLEAPPDLDHAAVISDLGRVAAGEVDVASLIARREGRRDVRPRPLAAPLRVSVGVDEQPEMMRIEVSGPAAPGALSRLAAVLSAAGLGVTGARVTTLGPEVRDVFFLRTPEHPPAGGWAAVEQQLRDAAGWPDRVVQPARSN